MSKSPSLLTDEELEACVLGSAFFSSRAQRMVTAQCSPKMFRDPLHSAIAKSLRQIPLGKQGADMILIRDHVRVEIETADDSQLNAMIGSVAQAVPSASNVEHYLALLQERYATRTLRSGLTSIARKIDAGDPTEDIFEQVAKLTRHAVLPSAGIGSFSDVRLGTARHRGVSSGIPSLDAMNDCGGFPCGQTTIAAAYHKTGKSAFLVTSAYNALEDGRRVLYATFADLDRVGLKRRMVRMKTGWAAQPETDLYAAEEWHMAVADMDLCFEWDFYESAKVRGGRYVETFCAEVAGRMDDRRYELILVDYAQKLYSNEARGDRLANAEICSNRLCELAAEFDVPIVVGSQITLGREGGQDMTKGSRVWEEDAGWVLRLKRDLENSPETAYFASPFCRFGQSGQTATLRFDDRTLSFKEIA